MGVPPSWAFKILVLLIYTQICISCNICTQLEPDYISGLAQLAGLAQFAEICTSVKCNKNQLCGYMTTRPAWLASRIPANRDETFTCNRVHQSNLA